MTRSLNALARGVSKAITRGARAQTPGERADAYHEAAEGLVSAREHFLTRGGEPDWLGRTYTYRQWTGDVYADSGVTGEERTKAQAAIRYHVGNLLRARLDTATIASLGLVVETPRERSVSQRAERSALLRAVTGSTTGLAGLDALHALLSARALLSRVQAPSLADLDRAETAQAREAVDDLRSAVARLSTALSAREASRRRASAGKTPPK